MSEVETVREKMIRLMDYSIDVVKRISEKEDAMPGEIAALPALIDSIVNITAYAVIEKKN